MLGKHQAGQVVAVHSQEDLFRAVVTSTRRSSMNGTVCVCMLKLCGVHAAAVVCCATLPPAGVVDT